MGKTVVFGMARVLQRRSLLALTWALIVLFVSVGAFGAPRRAPKQAAKPAVPTAPLFPLTAPFSFGYGTWDKKARIENNEAVLEGDGVTPKGGAGVNLNPPLDLRDRANASPVLRLRVGPNNTLRTLKLLIGDTGGHTGTFVFVVPPAGDTATALPVDGAALAQPNEQGETGALDLAHIMQWQLQGDWGSDGAVSLRVTGISSADPNDVPALALLRQEGHQRIEKARAQQAAERRAAREKYQTPTTNSPVVQAVYAAAPDVLALQIRSGTITPGKLLPYTPQPGDTPKTENGATLLLRGGERVGYLIGPRHDTLVTDEGFGGDPLLTDEADDKANYSVQSTDDPAYKEQIAPVSVARKTKPENWQQPKRAGLVLRHIVYLRLPAPLTPGRTYTVTTKNLNVQSPKTTLVFDPTRVRSESVHVGQVGFRSDDLVKSAFVSLWMGTGGGYKYADNMPFRLVEAQTGRTVFTRRAGAAWASETPEAMQTTRNFNGASVYPLDFSDFRAPGTYRVVVDGVGCSYPFTIGRDTWTKAFQTQMKGFYNQRSGIALGPPQTPFVKPVDFRLPTASAPITQSTYSILDGGDAQKDLARGDTGTPVPQAWGGYHDAGDWNPRRITHMRTTTFWQLELFDLFPNYFKTLRLGLPPTVPACPDLLSECRFELDLFCRLQAPSGGVGFGIETNGDPIDGEVSWKQSMPAYVYAPDVQSSYVFAAVAARMARVLAPYDPKAATAYRARAVRAMEWAESDRAARQKNGSWAKLPGDVTDDRALAAVCLLALTRETRWAQIFTEASPLKPDAKPDPFYGSLMRRDAAFTYARLPSGVGSDALKNAARTALLADADGALAYQKRNAWGIASDDPGKPQFLGFYSTPHGAVSLLRAFTLTKNGAYLAGAAAACQFPGGANPNNLVYTSGVGANSVRHPLHLDSRFTGQAAPVGLTVYGNVDFARWGDQAWIMWPITYFFGEASKPAPTEWPTTEAYFDVFFMIAQNEFTMDQTMGPNAYVWGYLAARP